MIKDASGQQRENIWILGTQISGNNLGLKFSLGSLDTFSSFHKLTFFITNSSICDTSGNLLFYTNGTYIANKNHDTLHNSKDFNSGYLTDIYYEGIGLGMPQGVIVLPIPEHDKRYLIVHMSGEEIEPPSGYYVTGLDLRYSEVDMNLDNGLGGIAPDKKKQVLVSDTMTYGQLTACKHANGRDWWIISHEYYTSRYYKFLLMPDSILGPYSQYIGSAYRVLYFGMNVFSPDGSKLVHIGQSDTLDIFNFDRCTGELSNNISFKLPDSIQSNSCAFSANGRFLYAATLLNVFQYDMWANDIEASVTNVAEYADTITGFPRWFGLMQLAPDNKIYISTYSGSTFLHVIDQPDSFGIACNVIQSGVVLPSYNSLSLPNFPNYDLGPLIGSPCDTLFLSNSKTLNNNATFRFSPNPVSNWLNIVYSTEEDGVLNLLDVNGRWVAGVSLFHYFKNRLLNVSQLPAGVYLAVVTQKGEKIWSEKVVVVH